MMRQSLDASRKPNQSQTLSAYDKQEEEENEAVRVELSFLIGIQNMEILVSLLSSPLFFSLVLPRGVNAARHDGRNRIPSLGALVLSGWR